MIVRKGIAAAVDTAVAEVVKNLAYKNSEKGVMITLRGDVHAAFSQKNVQDAPNPQKAEPLNTLSFAFSDLTAETVDRYG